MLIRKMAGTEEETRYRHVCRNVREELARKSPGLYDRKFNDAAYRGHVSLVIAAHD